MTSLAEQLNGAPAMENPTVQNIQQVDPQAAEAIGDDAVAQKQKRLNSIENTFNYDGAVKAGATNEQIIQHLEKSGANFDFEGARKAGASDADILAHLYDKAQPVKQEKQYEEDLNKLGPAAIDSDFHLGVMKSMTGVSKTANDILNTIGLRDNETYQKRFEEIDKWTKTFDRNIQDKDFFSAGTAGEIFPSLVTLPIAIQSKMAIFAIEGALGYAQARATEDAGTAGVIGLASGAIGAGIVKIFDSIGERGAKNVYEYYRNQLHYTDDEAGEVFKKWSNINETTGGYADKTKALIDHAGEQGAAIKSDIAKLSPSAHAAVSEGRATRFREMKKLVNDDINIPDFSERMHKQFDTVKTNYGVVKDEINNLNKVTTNEPLTIPESLDEIVTDRKAITDLIGHEDSTVSDFIEAMPHVNEIMRKVKGTHLNQWTKVKDQMDDAIRTNLTPQQYSKWREVNEDYKHMATVKNSKIGDAMLRATGKMGKKEQITTGRVLELIKADKDSGETTFESIRHIMGSGDTATLEKLIVKDALGDHTDDLSWKALHNSIEKKGFVSDEGKQLQDLIGNIAESFRTDDALKALQQKMSTEAGGIGTDLPTRFHVAVISKVFRMMQKHIPFTEGARNIRMEDALAKMLKSPNQMREINRAVSILGEGVKERMVTEVTQKLLEWKPNQGVFTRGVDTMYASTTGKVGKSIDSVNQYVVADDLVKWIQEVKLADDHIVGNKVIDSVYTYVDKNLQSFNKTLQRTNSRLRADDRAYNVKVVANAIKSEANELISYINKSNGVKLSKADGEKLTHMLFKRYVEGCE